MYKIDLHTHSVTSHDGGIAADQYRKAIESGLLDFIAITDHNSTDTALQLKDELGDRIIVGEEIMTTAGEIIGLYLEKTVPPNLTPLETIQAIRSQNGIVYIPHPFETVRKGLHPQTLEEIVDMVDVIEVCNGRAFVQNRSQQTVVWAKINKKISVASSDAHGYHGLGRTYTTVQDIPSRDNILTLLSNGTPITGRPTIRSLLYPKYNKIRKKIRSAK